MAEVYRTRDRIEEVVIKRLRQRAGPDDEIGVDVAIIPIDVACGECSERTGEYHTHRETMVTLYVNLAIPDEEAASVAHIMFPLSGLSSAEVISHVDATWDHIATNRMAAVSGMEVRQFNDGHSLTEEGP